MKRSSTRGKEEQVQKQQKITTTERVLKTPGELKNANFPMDAQGKKRNQQFIIVFNYCLDFWIVLIFPTFMFVLYTFEISISIPNKSFGFSFQNNKDVCIIWQ
jgi:hypothetical protein